MALRGRPGLFVIAILLISALVPAAAALRGEGSFSVAAPAVLAGDVGARASGAPVLLFGPEGSGPLDFTLDADTIVVDRRFADANNVCPPTIVGCSRVMDDEKGDRHPFETARAVASGTRPGFALYVEPLGRGAFDVVLNTTGRALLSGARTERVGTPGYDVQTSDDVFWGLEAHLARPHANLTAPRGEVVVTGDFSLFVWNVDYLVESPSGRQAFETGLIVKRDGVVRGERLEEHRLQVRGGVLRGTLVEGRLSVFPSEAAIDVSGLVTLPDARGRFQAPEGVVEAQGEVLTGHGTFAIRATYATSERVGLLDDGTPRLAVELHGEATSWSLPLIVMPAPFGAPDLTTGAAAGGTLILVAGAVAVLARSGRLRLLPRAKAGPEVALEELIAALEESRWAAAVRWADRVLAAQPANADVHLDKGLALEKLGRTQAARLAYEAALAHAPNRGDVHYHYARVLARLGLASAALTHLAEALALDARLGEQARGDPGFATLSHDPRFPR